MRFFQNMLNRTVKTIESKIVANRVRTMLDKVDTNAMIELFITSADMYSTSIIASGELIINLFNNNKEELVTLAENNSDTVIKLADIIKQLEPIITSLNNETNRQSLKTIKDTSITTIDSVMSNYNEKLNIIKNDMIDISKTVLKD